MVDALKIRQEYAGETSIEPSLTTVERNVIGYIAGNFLKSVVSLNQKLPSMKTAPAVMSFPNLIFMLYLKFTLGALVVGNNATERVSTYKILGVFIDRDLTWNNHVDYIYKKNLQEALLPTYSTYT